MAETVDRDEDVTKSENETETETETATDTATGTANESASANGTETGDAIESVSESETGSGTAIEVVNAAVNVIAIGTGTVQHETALETAIETVIGSVDETGTGTGNETAIETETETETEREREKETETADAKKERRSGNTKTIATGTDSLRARARNVAGGGPVHADPTRQTPHPSAPSPPPSTTIWPPAVEASGAVPGMARTVTARASITTITSHLTSNTILKDIPNHRSTPILIPIHIPSPGTPRPTRHTTARTRPSRPMEAARDGAQAPSSILLKGMSLSFSTLSRMHLHCPSTSFTYIYPCLRKKNTVY